MRLVINLLRIFEQKMNLKTEWDRYSGKIYSFYRAYISLLSANNLALDK